MRARSHVVLLGDSIFDNSAYVNGGPDVAAQLRAELGDVAQVTLLAIDGSVTSDIENQLVSLPADATHLIVSAGGNDILHHVAALDDMVGTLGAALLRLDALRAPFAASHRAMVGSLAEFDLPVAVCTIYGANFEGERRAMVATALNVFNDAITRNAHTEALDVIDLRLVCREPADYANPIEPSVVGGRRIAAALARYVLATEARPQMSRVFT